jgi:outer membrane protein assembly factor BamB
MYALDARTGDVRWTFEAEDRISGSATILGRIVYFSSLDGTTYGLSTRSGKQLWTWPDGRYTPVVADKGQMYVAGRTKLYAFKPQSALRDS